MKNPFVKQDNTGLIALAVVAVVATGALAYLYLTESGGEVRKSIKHKLKDEAKDLASGIISKKTGVKKRNVKKVADLVVK
ncbi:MAG: hypothetical protein M3O71_20155 [Bacteroidota bacterium]|nr:hypothetical protein [Bacteroidota bacterium]